MHTQEKDRDSLSFSSDQCIENTYNFLAASGGARVHFMQHAHLPFHKLQPSLLPATQN